MQNIYTSGSGYSSFVIWRAAYVRLSPHFFGSGIREKDMGHLEVSCGWLLKVENFGHRRSLVVYQEKLQSYHSHLWDQVFTRPYRPLEVGFVSMHHSCPWHTMASQGQRLIADASINAAKESVCKDI